METKPLSKKMVTTHAFKGLDVRKAINKTLKELYKNDFVNTNGVAQQEIMRIFKRNFGDALLGADE